MAVKYKSVSTSTAPVLVSEPSTPISDERQRGEHLTISNTGTVDVFIGDSTVTSTVGYKIAAGGTLQITLDRNDDALYAASTTAGTLSVLITGI